MNNTVDEVTQVLMEEYFGIGSTPETALDSLADDMAQNRIDIGVFDCTPFEFMQAVGNVLKRIHAGKKHEIAHWQQEVLAAHNKPEEEDWWFAIR
jgi:copper oxidase (laccase) domain-containing protein